MRKTAKCQICHISFRYNDIERPGKYCSNKCRGRGRIIDAMIRRAEKFILLVDKSGGPHSCWVWTGICDKNGYGMLGAINNKGIIWAHRYAWERVHGPIPDGLHVCHHCDNPPCVNAEKHLFLGTSADNAKDRHAKGRTCSGTIRFSDEQILEILSLKGQFSQTEVARKFGMDQTYVSDLWRGLTKRSILLGSP